MTLRPALLLQAIALAAAALCGANASAQDNQGNWLIRARAVSLDMANRSDAIPSLGVPANAITVNGKTIPELDVTYFFTPNIAAELVLTVPQTNTVTVQRSVLGGPADIGTFKYLPPTLMAQYHFNPNGTFRPYAGVGVNYTRIFSSSLYVPTVGKLSLNQNSFGLAAGVGMDIKLFDNVFLNVDVKYAQIGSDVKLAATGEKVSHVGLNPWLFGVGIGVRF
jgi:outer membrane protein